MITVVAALEEDADAVEDDGEDDTNDVDGAATFEEDADGW